MASAKDVTFRPAVYEDCKAILAIEVGDGLEHWLDEELLTYFFEEPLVHTFVAEYNDVVIGFIMLKEVDEDLKGGLVDYLRLEKSHRDKMIGDKLFRCALQYAKNETGIEYVRFLTIKSPTKRFGAEEVGRSAYLNFEGNAETLRTTLQSVPGLDDLPHTAVVSFEPEHVPKMLDPACGENVLTNGLLFADGSAYSLCEENLANLTRDDFAKCMYVDTNQPIRSISYGIEFECPSGTVCTIDVNCKDFELFKGHLIKNMQYACREYEGDISFSVLAIRFEDEIKAFCEGIEGLELSDEPGYHGVISKITL